MSDAAPVTLHPPGSKTATRLTVSLGISAFIVTLLQSGPHAMLWFAVLAPTPLLLAVRCLPLHRGIVVALLGPIVGRVVMQWDSAPIGDVVRVAVVSSLLWLLPLLLDRLCATWLLRFGFLAFPCAAVVLASLSDTFLWKDIAKQMQHPAQHDWLWPWSVDLSRTLVTWCLWMMASATSGLASVRNYFVPDPYSQAEREAGLRWGGVIGLFTLIPLFAGGWWRVRKHHGFIWGTPYSSEEIVFVCGAACVALFAVAFVARARRPRPLALPA